MCIVFNLLNRDKNSRVDLHDLKIRFRKKVRIKEDNQEVKLKNRIPRDPSSSN